MIPIFRPSMGDEEIEAVAEVLKSGWIGLGPKTEEFEKQFAEYIGTKYKGQKIIHENRFNHLFKYLEG
jgi:perosamine synthetase